MKKLLLTLLFATLGTVVSASNTSPNTTVKKYDDIKELVTIQAERHGIPVHFAHAIIRLESNYKPKVRGLAGEYGLGQIKCQTARGVGFTGNCRDLLIPEINLEYSMRYLKQGLDKTNGNLCRAAMYYNSGAVPHPNKGKSQYCRTMLSFLQK